MKPRVMVIIAARDVSGPAKGVFQLLEAFRGRGEFHLYTYRVGGHDTPFEDAARRRGIPLRHFSRRGILPGLRQVTADVKRLGIDIVQTHGFKPSVFGLQAKLTTSAKWLCFLHGRTSENLKVRLYHELDRAVQRFADRTVIVCDAQRCQLPGGADRDRVRVIYNAIDCKSPVPRSNRSVRAALGLAAGTPLVVTVGRLSPEKGVDLFIDAIARVRSAVTDLPVHALVVGEGQERHALEAHALRRRVADVVHFLGRTDTPGDAIEQADIVVIPSRSEACPNVLLEAMALGTPVVSTRVGGVPELVTNGEQALVVEPGDDAALAGSIVRLLRSRELGLSLAEQARTAVRARFTPEARAAAVWSLYEELLSRRSSELVHA